ncbi:uncharacterized protein Gasu_12690 [Galdieria sulphuraria]|uniref:LIM zinc-binding domain-containing protein n=1 Tax=Galdieria sulphuraria TaxID=130081 RepID=M2Y6X0_GALSU|nr:uncharacterized protein Gasu_12690 [Galdieria sulphuraria]EME31599.1 hypothetical protein Gasu_12690 [Galdieria sulphuraria]|eukprot:XP_005708119.1 hypothetical protein Gasu_12690 [Galdieria sulphuraria]
MEWKVPASYCIHCGDLKRLCRCNGKAATVEAKDSGFVQLKQEESGRELDKVDNSMKVSDKLDKVKEEATGTKISQDNQRSVFKTREILKELENSNIVPPFSNSSLENEESKISENISHSVYETFGVRLRSKEKLSTVENMAQTLNKDSINDGKSKEENESHSVSNWEENEPNKQQTRHVSDAIASKLVLFDSPEQSESAIPQKISYSCTKGATCVVCRRSVHPIEKFLSPNGELYHMNCLRCSICQCLLDSSCLNCFENNFLCNKCFVKKPRSIPNNRSSSYM